MEKMVAKDDAQVEQKVAERPPFPKAKGDGIVEFAFVRGKTALKTLRSTYPLKMMHLRGTPRTSDSDKTSGGESKPELPGAEWVYMLGHGGGIVSGDVQRIKVDVGEGCTAIMTTQSFTKVYHQHLGQTARQLLRASVAPGALLVLLPDPIVPFHDSRFTQHQEFDLVASGSTSSCSEGASLIVLDWLTSGRRSRGENWQMERYESVNTVRIASKCVLHDALKLSREPLNLSIEQRMQPFHCVAMVILIGPRTQKLAAYLLELINTRQTERILDEEGEGTPFVGGKRRRHPGEGEEAPWDGLICSASEIAGQVGVVVRVAGHDYVMVEKFLRTHLKGLEEQCGRDVWTKKMCLH
mmetsp:Transcript_32735/g.52701  ORF Transcript_32735/g.52701 Transcript_32735/m.52701 type:complete len:354 (+) Transcript_32735:3-1064(+)